MQSSFDTHPLNSWYPASVERVDYPARQSGRNVNVCVIGGGNTGLTTALNLSKGAANVLLIEASRIGGEASGRNGGQIWTGCHHSQSDLEKKHGKQIAHDLWDISLLGRSDSQLYLKG